MSTLTKYKLNIETLSFERVKERTEWKRIIFRVIILMALAYFIIGIIFVKYNLIQKEDYLLIAAIVGGIASVSGLFTFSTSKLHRSDIEEIGIEYFKDLVKSAEQLKEKETDIKQKETILSAKEKELQKLELDRAELEFIVKKASMSIFLQDQYERLNTRIIEIIHDNKDLTNLLGQREHLLEQLTKLGEELKSSDISQTIQEIIELIKTTQKPEKKEKTFIEVLKDVLLAFLSIKDVKI